VDGFVVLAAEVPLLWELLRLLLVLVYQGALLSVEGAELILLELPIVFSVQAELHGVWVVNQARLERWEGLGRVSNLLRVPDLALMDAFD